MIGQLPSDRGGNLRKRDRKGWGRSIFHPTTIESTYRSGSNLRDTSLRNELGGIKLCASGEIK